VYPEIKVPGVKLAAGQSGMSRKLIENEDE
jgi:hypothetical protein